MLISSSCFSSFPSTHFMTDIICTLFHACPGHWLKHFRSPYTYFAVWHPRGIRVASWWHPGVFVGIHVFGPKKTLDFMWGK